MSARLRSLKRTAYPTASPSGTPSSCAIRSATVRAASRRGWVWAIVPAIPRPSSRQIFGSWVVLPLPVSPATIDDLVVADRGGDLVLALADRELRRIGDRRDRGAAARAARLGGGGHGPQRYGR